MERMDIKDLIQKDPRKILDILKKGEERAIVEELWAFSMDETETKQLRKVVKKALYIIKSNGIDIDKYKPEPDEKTEDVKEEAVVHSVLASIPDSGGHSVLVFAVAGAGETSFDIMRFLIGPDRCIHKYSKDRGSKKHFEKFKAENPAFFPLRLSQLTCSEVNFLGLANPSALTGHLSICFNSIQPFTDWAPYDKSGIPSEYLSSWD